MRSGWADNAALFFTWMDTTPLLVFISFDELQYPFGVTYHPQCNIRDFLFSIGASSAVFSWARPAPGHPTAGRDPRSAIMNGKMAERYKGKCKSFLLVWKHARVRISFLSLMFCWRAF